MNKIIFIGFLIVSLISCNEGDSVGAGSNGNNGTDIKNEGGEEGGGEEEEPAECISSGSGDSAEDPIILCTYDDLNRMREDLDEDGYIIKYYALGADIDALPSRSEGTEGCNAYDGTTIASENPCSGLEPLPVLKSGFDGKNYKITNLYINMSGKDVGLFKAAHQDAPLKNLHLRDVRINNTKDVSPARTGGIMGGDNNNYNPITHCSVTGKITGSGGSTGGIIGEGGIVTNSYADVVVVGRFAGGITGYSNTAGKVYSSYAKGSVTAATGASRSYIGGLVGSLDESAKIRNSYANVTVSGSSGVASLVAGLSPSIQIHNSYGVGLVTYTGANEASDPIGGLTGDEATSITISNSFWDTETTGQDSSFGDGTGLTTSEMQVACPTGTTTGICALGGGFVFTAGSYPKLKKCLSNCDSNSATFSNELLEGQD